MDDGRGEQHRYFEGLAVAHVLGSLDETDGRIFRAHLLECSDCRAHVGELRAIAHDLADVERDERRVRAAKAIETKRRESDEDTADEVEVPPGTRASRTLVIVGLGLILLLAMWNFRERDRAARLEIELHNRLEAQTVLEYGRSWTVVEAPAAANPRMKATAKDDDGHLVLLVDGLEDEKRYWLYLLTDGDAVKAAYPARPLNGRIFPLIALPADVAEVRLNLVEGKGTGEEEILGESVFVARRPAG